MDTSMEKHPHSKLRIRFQDCDPFGHLNNARYLDYFFNAREEHLRDYYGIDVYGEKYQQQSWVVRNSSVSHVQPAVFNQVVLIQTGLVEVARSRLKVEAFMMSEDRSHLLAAAWVEFVFVNLATGRPARHPEELMRVLEPLCLNVPIDSAMQKSRLQDWKQLLAA